MREDAFRALLTAHVGRSSVASYLSNARSVERLLSVDLDACDLSDRGVVALREALVLHGMDPRRASDCASALRRYATIDRPPGVEPPPSTIGPAPDAEDASLARLGTLELLALRGRVDDELRDRGVTRTGNGPVGDYAEALFAHAFDWTLERNSAAGHDATDAAGVRYQIKARREGRSPGVRQLSAIRRLPERDFDWLGAVIFDGRFQVRRALLMPHHLVQALARRVEHTNSWRLMLSDRLWRMDDVRDVTDALGNAQATLPDRIIERGVRVELD